MHCVELGIGQDIAGHILYESLVLFDGKNRAERVKLLETRLKVFYTKSTATNRYGVLHLSQFKSGGDQPKLKGKASECRGIQPFCLQLAHELFDTFPTEHNFQVLSAIDGLCALSRSLDAEPFQEKETQRLGQGLLDAMIWLHEEEETDFWRLKPKAHMLHHLLYDVIPKH
eukprot:2631152-Amphidinium_carterae.1